MNFRVLAVNHVIKVSPLYLTYCVFFLFLPHGKTKPSPRMCEPVRINVSPTSGSGFHGWVRWGGWAAVLGGKPASARGRVLAHRYPTPVTGTATCSAHRMWSPVLGVSSTSALSSASGGTVSASTDPHRGSPESAHPTHVCIVL